MRQLKILLVSRSIPLHSYGGMELVAWDLAQEFKNQGHLVSILTTAIQGKPEKFSHDGIVIYSVSDTKSGRYSASWWKNSFMYFTKNLEDTTDVVLSVSAGAYGLLDNDHKNNIPYILQAHGTSWGEIISKIRERSFKSIAKALLILFSLRKDFKYYARFDAFVAAGEAVYEDALKFPLSKVLDKRNIYLIRNGIDRNLFSFDLQKRKNLRSKFKINDNETVIISASRLHKQKGVHLGLLGFAEYIKLNPNSTYIIIGGGPERENLQKLTSQLRIADRVIFTGSLERHTLAEYLNMGDLFLFTTLHEEVGLSLNILEALSSGLKVVISSHIEGITKINQDAVIPVNPKFPKEIAKALATVVDENRKSYLPEEYSLEYCAGEYIKLFNNLISK